MCKIVIVDDEKYIRVGISKSLPWIDIGIKEVFTAASGKEALEIINTNMPEIMLTDINMAEMTGLDLVEEALKIKKDMKILVLTGYDKFEYARTCLRLNVQDFYLKPIDEGVLAKAIEEQVNALKEKKAKEEENKRKQRALGNKQQHILEKNMREIVHNRYSDYDIEKFLDRYQYKREELLQVAILIPILYKSGEIKDGEFLILSLVNISLEFIDTNNLGITFRDDDGKIVIFLFAKDGSIKNSETISILIELMKNEYDVAPKFVLGSIVEGFENAYISYNDAMILVNTNEKNIDEIILTNFEKKREKLFLDIFEEQKRVMCTNLDNPKQVLRIFDSFTSAVLAYNLSDYFASKCCFEMAASFCYSYFRYTGENIDNALHMLLQNLKNINAEEACSLTRMMMEKIMSNQNLETHEIVSKAKIYIEEHLADDISVSNLADLFFVTPNYFSRLFKRVLGEGCNEFIVRRRIEKAKSLLETTSLKTGVISIMVGYHDTNYFSLAFKKNIGVSPTRYREECQTKNIIDK